MIYFEGFSAFRNIVIDNKWALRKFYLVDVFLKTYVQPNTLIISLKISN